MLETVVVTVVICIETVQFHGEVSLLNFRNRKQTVATIFSTVSTAVSKTVSTVSTTVSRCDTRGATANVSSTSRSLLHAGMVLLARSGRRCWGVSQAKQLAPSKLEPTLL